MDFYKLNRTAILLRKTVDQAVRLLCLFTILSISANCDRSITGNTSRINPLPKSEMSYFVQAMAAAIDQIYAQCPEMGEILYMQLYNGNIYEQAPYAMVDPEHHDAESTYTPGQTDFNTNRTAMNGVTWSGLDTNQLAGLLRHEFGHMAEGSDDESAADG